MYVAAWPLLKNYPGQEFQSGLFGTWMFAQYDGPTPKDHYSDIEGGLGWWRDTRFATETPKFIMGGVALNFSEWANGPGAGKGRDWKKPAGHYAVAQLSPWVLWPPDGLNLKQGTSGELFGYGYLPLPLTTPKKTTAGKDVPTGNHCWTLFLNTGNFKGPVTFFLPYFWSRPSVENPKLAACSSTPGRPSRTRRCRWRPSTSPRTSPGTRRETPTPGSPPRCSPGNRTGMRRWCIASPRTARPRCGTASRRGSTAGRRRPARSTPRPPASTPSTARAGPPGRSIPPTPHGTRRCRSPGVRSPPPSPSMTPLTVTGGPRTLVTKADAKDGSLVTLPEYYRLEKDTKDKEQWVVVSPKDVPAETGLAKVEFPEAREAPTGALRHARRGGQLLEEAGAGGRTVRGEAG